MVYMDVEMGMGMSVRPPLCILCSLTCHIPFHSRPGQASAGAKIFRWVSSVGRGKCLPTRLAQKLIVLVGRDVAAAAIGCNRLEGAEHSAHIYGVG